MKITKKAKIFKNIWFCAYQRRYNAKIENNWKKYESEHETVLACLQMKNAKWWEFDSEKNKFLC